MSDKAIHGSMAFMLGDLVTKRTGSEWSGRGLKPNWLRAAIMGGAKLESFQV